MRKIGLSVRGWLRVHLHAVRTHRLLGEGNQAKSALVLHRIPDLEHWQLAGRTGCLVSALKTSVPVFLAQEGDALRVLRPHAARLEEGAHAAVWGQCASRHEREL